DRGRNRLAGIALVVAEAWTGVYFEAVDLVVRRYLKIDSGKGEVQRFRELYAFFRKFIGQLGFPKLRRRSGLPRCVPIICSISAGGRGEDLVANGVNPDIRSIYKCLKLRRAPSQIFQPLLIRIGEFLHDRTDGADRLVNDAAMA